jgi:RimJ/RimL family protein N-acetyltransferase
LLIEQLRTEHLAELATHLRHPEVFEHIGGMPSLEDFILDREIALRGPGPGARDERWLNFLVRERSTKQIIGRLEATLHEAIAEVAFLFSPPQWGKGFAQEALAWLHDEIRAGHGISSFWATTVPANTRCQALLLRAGYKQVHEGVPVLYTLEEGDLVFHLRDAA